MGAYVDFPSSGATKLAGLPRLKYYNALKWENSLYGWTLSKILIILKNASNKNGSKLNLLQRS